MFEYINQDYPNKYGEVDKNIIPEQQRAGFWQRYLAKKVGAPSPEEVRSSQDKQQARQRVQGLLGQRPEIYQGEMAGPSMQGQPAPQFVRQPVMEGGEGRGLLGGKSTPAEFYGGLLTTPGYEPMGSQGLQGLLSAKQKQGFTLSPGQTRFDSQGQPVANVAPTEGTSKAEQNRFNQEQKLREKFQAQVGDYVKIRDAWGRIQASASDPSAAGDLALVFNYMKVLDPGSTVREGEFATAQNAAGVPTRVLNVYNKIQSGEILAPEQRNDFVGRAEKLYNSQEKGLKQLEGEYTKLATGYNLTPANVIPDYRVNYADKVPQGKPKPAKKYNPTTGKIE